MGENNMPWANLDEETLTLIEDFRLEFQKEPPNCWGPLTPTQLASAVIDRLLAHIEYLRDCIG